MIDFSKLDKLIHEKSRLSIMTLLAARKEWRFQDLKSELGMSDGNLVTHMRALYKAGYVSIIVPGRARYRRTIPRSGIATAPTCNWSRGMK